MQPVPGRSEPHPVVDGVRATKSRDCSPVASDIVRSAPIPGLDFLHRVSDLFEHLSSSLHDDQWELPTPCSDWSVAQLVNHVVGGNWFTIRILNEQPADVAIADTIESFTPSLDRVAAAVSSTRTQTELSAQPGALDRRCSHVVGYLSGAEALQLRLHDLIIHNWDLARALDTPATIADDLIAWAIADLLAPDSLSARHFDIASSDLARHEAEPQLRLLAAFGRSG